MQFNSEIVKSKKLQTLSDLDIKEQLFYCCERSDVIFQTYIPQKEKLTALRRAIPIVFIIVVTIGGIYGGVLAWDAPEMAMARKTFWDFRDPARSPAWARGCSLSVT